MDIKLCAVVLSLVGSLFLAPIAKAQIPSDFTRAQALLDESKFDEAILLLQPLARSGDALSTSLLGFVYAKRNQPGDDTLALASFRSAALAGDASAQFMLGTAYHNGHFGVAVDEFEAAKWSVLAARQGVADSQGLMGFFYAAGDGGVQKNIWIAVCWLRLAALQGDAGAQYNLGRLTIMGEGVPEDYVEGYKWLNLAAANGNEKAVSLRSALRPLLSPGQLSDAQRASTNFRKQVHSPEDDDVDCP